MLEQVADRKERSFSDENNTLESYYEDPLRTLNLLMGQSKVIGY